MLSLRLASIGTALLLCGGCSLGKTADKMTLKMVAPAMMSSADLEMACATGEALAQPVGAVPGKHPPNKALVLTWMSAGMCGDLDAWNAELRRLRAVHAGQASLAADLLEVERRDRRLAAMRNYEAWKNLQAGFGAVEACPELDASRNEGLAMVLGLSTGLLAVLSDSASGGQAGVPTETVLAVERGSECLNAADWWGVPVALRAAVWATVPGQLPEGEDWQARLEEAAVAGEEVGVDLARALQIQVLATVGEDAALRAALSGWAASRGSRQLNGDYALLNEYAYRMIRHESDKIWMEATGQRTAAGTLGMFPEEPGVGEDLGGLLDGLFDEPAPEPGASSEDLDVQEGPE